jgi:nicotinamide mononucleotide transporter
MDKFIEILGVATGIICVVLASKKNIISWPIGLINVLCYLYIFYNVKLYADFGEQVFYLITQITGWLYWWKNKNKKNNIIVHVDALGGLKFLGVVVISIGLGLLVGKYLNQFTDASYPYVDAVTTTLSFAAQLLLTFKKKENWIIWIVIDVVGIWLYTLKSLYFTTGLYVIYLANAIYGFIQWKKDYDENRNRNRQVFPTS